MPDSKAKRKWDKKHVTFCMIKLFDTTDKDILRFLEAQDKPKSTVFKAAMREYMGRRANNE